MDSSLTIQDKEDPAPPEVQDEFTDEELEKDIVLRTISKSISQEYVIPLAMHLYGLTETEVLNLALLPHQRNFDEQRYYLLERWKQRQEEGATFSQLIQAFKAVKMTAAAGTLNRNLLTDKSKFKLHHVNKTCSINVLFQCSGISQRQYEKLYSVI